MGGTPEYCHIESLGCLSLVKVLLWQSLTWTFNYSSCMTLLWVVKNKALCQAELPCCHNYFDGLEQDCSNSSVLTMELPQSCTKPLISCSTNSYFKPSVGNVSHTRTWKKYWLKFKLKVISSEKYYTIKQVVCCPQRWSARHPTKGW